MGGEPEKAGMSGVFTALIGMKYGRHLCSLNLGVNRTDFIDCRISNCTFGKGVPYVDWGRKDAKLKIVKSIIYRTKIVESKFVNISIFDNVFASTVFKKVKFVGCLITGKMHVKNCEGFLLSSGLSDRKSYDTNTDILLEGDNVGVLSKKYLIGHVLHLLRKFP